MARFFTRPRITASIVDGIVVAVMIFILDVFLSKRPVSFGLAYGAAFGAVAFLIRVFTRPNRVAASGQKS